MARQRRRRGGDAHQSEANGQDRFCNLELMLGDRITEFDYKVAQEAWHKGLAVSSIITALGLEGGKNAVNLTRVRRSLMKVVRYGLLELNPPPLSELENEIQRLSPAVETIHVENDRMTTCFKAAKLIDEEISDFLHGEEPGEKGTQVKDRMVIANAGGRTVREIADFLQRLVPLPPLIGMDKQLIFLSLNAAEAHSRFDECANYLAVRMSQIYGCKHIAVVKDPSDAEKREYMDAVHDIDLLVSSVGSIPSHQKTRGGFLAHWLQDREKDVPPSAIGDIAFHLIDESGDPVKLPADAERMVNEHISPAPDWNTLDLLFRTNKVLLVLVGDKVKVGRALMVSARAKRLVMEGSLASALVHKQG